VRPAPLLAQEVKAKEVTGSKHELTRAINESCKRGVAAMRTKAINEHMQLEHEIWTDKEGNHQFLPNTICVVSSCMDT